MPAAGKVQRRAMIDRGANYRQSQRDVHAAPEACMLQHRQTLIVVHRQHRVALRQAMRREQRIRRQRFAHIHALRTQFIQYGDHNVELFASQIAALTRMRIKPRHQNARTGNAKTALQIMLHDGQYPLQQFAANAVCHFAQGQMYGCQRHAHATTHQHHYHQRRMRKLCQKLGMAGERNARVIDHAFVHRCCHHRTEFARLATRHSTFQQ